MIKNNLFKKMMTNNGGFQSIYPPNGSGSGQKSYNGGGGNYNSFHRSNTYMPPNPYSNPNYPPQQPYAPPQQPYMPPQQPYAPPQQPYAPPQQPYAPPQQPYMPPPVAPLQHTNTYTPPPQPLPPMGYPPQNPNPPQTNSFHRSNTYMPPSPYQNPPPQYPPPQYPPQQNPPPQYPPPQYPPQQNPPSQYPPQQNPPSQYPPQQNPPPQYPPQQNPPMNPPQPSPGFYRSNTYQPPRPSGAGLPPMPPMGPSNFNPEQDCQILRNAVHGVGTDEKAIINIIVNRNAAQRAEIRNCYKSCFGKDLIKRLKEDTSGNFKEVIAGMFMTPAEYDAMCLYKAMKGLGTNEGVLIEIIGTRTNEQLRQVKDVFEKEYKNTLENWVKGDTSGNFRNLLIALLQCDRSTNPNPDPNMCQADAQALYNAGEGRWGTDEPTFIKIFSKRSAAEIAMINDCYMKLRGKGLLKAIDKEFSGDIKKLLQTVVGGLLDPAGYFATRIREAVKGLGTNDAKLVRVIVSRSEVDLPYIKQAYQRIYGRDMLHDVRDDTSGYYRDILTGIISRV